MTVLRYEVMTFPASVIKLKKNIYVHIKIISLDRQNKLS